jgi:AcrR family transcriptional regulator
LSSSTTRWFVVVLRKQPKPDRDIPVRRRRADAIHNRARILDAAGQIFGEKGAAGSTEEVSKRAGVGIGTVFRHFPTKEALLEELLRTRLAELAAEANALAPAEGDALFRFFAHFVEQASKKHAVVATLSASGVDVTGLMTKAGSELRAAVRRLLVRAQQAGDVRQDVGVAEVLGILMGLAHATEQGAWDRRMQRRALTVIFDGLRRSQPIAAFSSKTSRHRC